MYVFFRHRWLGPSNYAPTLGKSSLQNGKLIAHVDAEKP
jgi:hypothetical protein